LALEGMLPTDSFRHCLGGVWKFWNTPTAAPPYFSLFFPPILGGYQGLKE
jgi:hypothetical protein